MDLIDRQEMEKLPEDVMIEKILLKLPASSLVNLRYVSKDLWRLITSPSFIKLHLIHHSSSIAQLDNNNNNNYHNLLLICSPQVVACACRCGKSAFKPVTHNYACNFPIITSSTSATAATVSIRPEIVEMHIPFESTEIRASCNGLLYLHQRLTSFGIDGRRIEDVSYYIWNPCTKEYKELPPPPPLLPPLLLDDDVDVGVRSNSSSFCGFGYDRKNDEYKILHYENRLDRSYIVHADLLHPELHSITSVMEFNLYTLGTNTWKRIADNPYSSFYFKESFYRSESSKRIGFLVNGALHWIMSLTDPRSKGKIISFDIEKEVFREVQKPCYYHPSSDDDYYYYCESLQILQECLCMCQIHPPHGGEEEVNFKIDIWMLQDYDVIDSWTKLFRVVIPGNDFGYQDLRLLRYCENGEIVMRRNAKQVIVYDPVNHKARCAQKINEYIGNGNGWLYSMDYTESLVCLNSGTYSTDTGRLLRPHMDTYINSYCNKMNHKQKEGDSICFVNRKKRRRTLTEPKDVC